MLYLVHPFASSRHFPSRGNEKIGGTGYCVTYDTESQSRNVLASPLGEEGHEVAKGWTVVILIMILYADVTAEGGIIKLIARKGNPQPSAPQALSPLERSDAQPFYTTCGEAAPLFYNLRRQPPPPPSA